MLKSLLPGEEETVKEQGWEQASRLLLSEHQDGRASRAEGIQGCPSFCVAVTPLEPSLICATWSCAGCVRDLWAAWSGNPSPGSLLGLLSATTLNIRPAGDARPAPQ